MIYVTNSPIVPLSRGTKDALIRASEVSLEEARGLLAGREFVSAVGHQSTADALSLLLGIKVPFNRTQVFLGPGDQLLAFSLLRRLEEGRVITNVEEILSIGFTFTLFERLQ
jgi:hypothetical protein